MLFIYHKNLASKHTCKIIFKILNCFFHTNIHIGMNNFMTLRIFKRLNILEKQTNKLKMFNNITIKPKLAKWLKIAFYEVLSKYN